MEFEKPAAYCDLDRIRGRDYFVDDALELVPPMEHL